MAIASVEAIRVDTRATSYASKGASKGGVTPAPGKPAGGEGSAVHVGKVKGGLGSLNQSPVYFNVGSVATILPLGETG